MNIRPSRSITLLALITASVLSGCATFSADGGFSGIEQTARQRLGKVAVHETGHTLGLDHCSSDGCLMHDGEGTVLTSDTEYDLCARCRGILARAGRVLPSAPKIPWPKPT